MATLSFHKEEQSYVSDSFEGGKVIQLSFPPEGIRVLFIESRLGATLPWKSIDSKMVERNMIVNVPAIGDGQEFRIRCVAEPSSVEIIPMSSGGGGGGGGSQPGPNTVGSREIQDDSVEMEDLSSSVKDSMVTDKDRVTQEELDNFQP